VTFRRGETAESKFACRVIQWWNGLPVSGVRNLKTRVRVEKTWNGQVIRLNCIKLYSGDIGKGIGVDAKYLTLGSTTVYLNSSLLLSFSHSAGLLYRGIIGCNLKTLDPVDYDKMSFEHGGPIIDASVIIIHEDIMGLLKMINPGLFHPIQEW
jgi:hypothetical protein